MKLLGTLLAALLLVMALMWAFDPTLQERREDRAYYEQQRQALALERERAAFEREEARAEVMAPAVTAMQLILWVGLVVSGAMLGATLLDFYRLRREPLIYADEFGNYPIARQHIEQGDVLALVEQVALMNQQVRALAEVHRPGQTPQVMHQTYSPHFEYESKGIRDTPPTEEATGTLPALASFAQLFEQGKLGQGDKLYLGIDMDTGEALTGTWLDLYSTAIGGLPGTGKTTTQRFLAAQTAMQGAQFVIVDPHAGAGQDSLTEALKPLSQAFLCEPASDDAGILAAVRLVDEIGRRRVQGDSDRTPIMLWADELTRLLGRSSVAEPLAELLEQIAQEYRKVGVYATASGQIWTASRTGDSTALRDSFASVIAHRMKRSQGRMLLPTEEAQIAERMSTGQAVLWRSSGSTHRIAIPDTTSADIAKVARHLQGGRSGNGSNGNGFHGSFDPLLDGLLQGSHCTVIEGEAKSVKTPSETATKAGGETGFSAEQSAEAKRIVALFFQDGQSVGQIVKILYGDIKGQTYNDRRAHVEQVLREARG